MENLNYVNFEDKLKSDKSLDDIKREISKIFTENDDSFKDKIKKNSQNIVNNYIKNNRFANYKLEIGRAHV